MKLHHISLRLLAALATASFITPIAKADRTVTIIIYEGFPWKFGEDDTTNGIKLAGDDKAIFNLSGNYGISDYTPTETDPITGNLIQRHPTWNKSHHFITGGTVEFTSSGNSKVSFTDGYSTPFYQQKNLSFHNLSGLTFANIDRDSEGGGAIRLADDGNLSIRNITDNNSTTADVIFSNVKGGYYLNSSSSYIGGVITTERSIFGSNIDISSNGDVSFLNNPGVENTTSYTIHAGEGKISICDNEDVLFQENGNNSGTICCRRGGNIELNGNDSISFIKNGGSSVVYTDSASATITMQNNGDITFRENKSYGIYSHGNCILDNNGNITFEKNGHHAIHCYGEETHITNNKNIVFKEHDQVSIYSQNLVNISGNQDVTFSDNTHQCLTGKNISISGNHNVLFANNQRGSSTTSNSLRSGAINGDVTFTQNKKITFSNNESSNDGGAIEGATIFENNGDIIFSGNAANRHGGAISGKSTFTNNGNITFSNNTAGGERGSAINGGATISNNGNITFENNITRSTTSAGGAIHSSTNPYITIVANKDVSFCGNKAISEDSTTSRTAYAGAIYSGTSITNNLVLQISNNAAVEFSGNGAIAHNNDSKIYAGAIYTYGAFTIAGNDSVTFSGNYRYWKTEESDKLHLRSINTYSTLNLSAKSGGHITFNDSVYASSTVNLNADYTDAAGETQKATGAIIFSGKTTEQQLNTILEAEGANRTATESEISDSRTSTFTSSTTLQGGSLQVKDQAILNINRNLTVAAGSNAEIVVSNNAALNGKQGILLEEGGNAALKVQGASVSTSTNFEIEIAGSNSLELSDGASITTNTVYIKSQASLSVADTMKRGAHALAEVAEAAPLVFNTAIGAEFNANLNLAGGATFEADGACIDMNGYNITLGVTSSTEKIALQLTLGAPYEEDSLVMLFANAGNVTFSADKVTAKPTDSMLTLMAADYFSGDWINEDTKLIYDQGNVYVTGVNRVQIPEPATATLSLLALAALAARRRRRG